MKFERGKKERALRDVLARRIPKNSREPHAVATSLIKKKGKHYWEKRLPKKEVAKEFKEQKEMKGNPSYAEELMKRLIEKKRLREPVEKEEKVEVIKEEEPIGKKIFKQANIESMKEWIKKEREGIAQRKSPIPQMSLEEMEEVSENLKLGITRYEGRYWELFKEIGDINSWYGTGKWERAERYVNGLRKRFPEFRISLIRRRRSRAARKIGEKYQIWEKGQFRKATKEEKKRIIPIHRGKGRIDYRLKGKKLERPFYKVMIPPEKIRLTRKEEAPRYYWRPEIKKIREVEKLARYERKRETQIGRALTKKFDKNVEREFTRLQKQLRMLRNQIFRKTEFEQSRIDYLTKARQEILKMYPQFFSPE